MRHLRESILSKNTSVYKDEPPKDRTDKDGIIDWLEKNGFERLAYSENTTELKYHNFGKCYSLGLYKDDNLATWWINAGDGKGNAILVRTIDNADLKKANKTAIVPFKECTICEKDKPYREGTWKEARELLIKMAEI